MFGSLNFINIFAGLSAHIESDPVDKTPSDNVKEDVRNIRKTISTRVRDNEYNYSQYKYTVTNIINTAKTIYNTS